ncbi:MAG: hypothetical protein WCK35_16125 [Chloroflexota bacterium]
MPETIKAINSGILLVILSMIVGGILYAIAKESLKRNRLDGK